LRGTASKCHDGKCELSSSTHAFFGTGSPMAIVSVGIDLAKNVLAIHGVDESDRSRTSATVNAAAMATHQMNE
jgi:hypothetical protein